MLAAGFKPNICIQITPKLYFNTSQKVHAIFKNTVFAPINMPQDINKL